MFPVLMRRLAVAGPLLAMVVLLPLGSGCNKEPALPPLVPVKGKVLVDNEPVSGGNVTFFPVQLDENSKAPQSVGIIDNNGNYELSTGGKSGAPAGKYKVMVTPGMVPMQGAKSMPTAPFNEKYRDANKTPLQVDVPSSSYDLKLTK